MNWIIEFLCEHKVLSILDPQSYNYRRAYSLLPRFQQFIYYVSKFLCFSRYQHSLPYFISSKHSLSNFYQLIHHPWLRNSKTKTRITIHFLNLFYEVLKCLYMRFFFLWTQFPFSKERQFHYSHEKWQKVLENCNFFSFVEFSIII